MATGSSRKKGIAKWRENKTASPAQKRAAKLNRALTPRGKKVITIKGGDTAPF